MTTATDVRMRPYAGEADIPEIVRVGKENEAFLALRKPMDPRP